MCETLARFEAELTEGCSPDRQALIRAILERWRYDRDLTEQSRRRATSLLRLFRSLDP